MSRPAFLHHMKTLAAADPCVVPRADLLRLLAMAGLADTHTFRTIQDGDADWVTVSGADLLKTVGLAGG